MKDVKRGAAAIIGVGALAAVGVLALIGAVQLTDPSPSPSPDPSISAPPVSARAEFVTHVSAEPATDPVGRPAISLTSPAPAEPGTSVEFEVRWSSPSGEPVSGALDLQRIEGSTWTTVGTLTTEAGTGSTTLTVPESGIYRLGYGGSDTIPAVVSQEITVTAGPPIPSNLTVTVTPDPNVNAATHTLTAAWTMQGGVAITGPLVVEAAQGEEWAPVTTVTTGDDGIATVGVEAAASTRYRVSYAGGSRFSAAVSGEAVALGDDARTIPVSSCSDDGDIDVLDRGAGCHYTPVTVGTFVVAHDYLDNQWWNTVPVNSYIRLSGEFAGAYQVIDRVMAPARGADLGPAENWTCGDECDVILQTCQGQKTGFTWLRRVGE